VEGGNGFPLSQKGETKEKGVLESAHKYFRNKPSPKDCLEKRRNFWNEDKIVRGKERPSRQLTAGVKKEVTAEEGKGRGKGNTRGKKLGQNRKRKKTTESGQDAGSNRKGGRVLYQGKAEKGTAQKGRGDQR